MGVVLLLESVLLTFKLHMVEGEMGGGGAGVVDSATPMYPPLFLLIDVPCHSEGGVVMTRRTGPFGAPLVLVD